MNIGFDAKRAFYNARGLGSYSRTLIRAMINEYPDHTYHLYSPKDKRNSTPLMETPLGVRTNHQYHLSGSLWRVLSLGKEVFKDKLDIYHGLSAELPWIASTTKPKLVVTIHDLTFLRHPHFYPWIDRMIYRKKTLYSLNHADAVVAISENTKQDILEFYGLDPEKVTTIQPICDPEFFTERSAEESDTIRHIMNLPSEYILCVGSEGWNKNIQNVLQALALTPDCSLVIVGRNHFKKLIQRLNLRKRVLFIDPETGVSVQTLSMIYRLASLTVYVSHYEGFGLPIIESLASGTPVISSNTSSMPEATGKGGILINPNDPAEISQAISKLLTDSAMMNSLTQAGRRHAKHFQAKNKAHQLMGLYSSLG